MQLSLAVFPAVLVAVCLCTSRINGQFHKRFEYKHSFKGPQLVQRDKSIPFWTHSGDAIASSDWVRVAPSLKSQRGVVVNKFMKTDNITNWEVELTFKVMGQGRIGADGLAFWYTKSATMLGPVFGAQDRWNGLGIFFDTFDNDAQGNNPYISAMVNDESKLYDHQSDGFSQQVGGCFRDFRNKPFPVRARITYANKVLTVLVHNGLQKEPTEASYELCLRVDHVELPPQGFFGVSAATGGLADDHDVLSFITHSLKSDQEHMKDMISDEDRKKYEHEYSEYEKKFEEAKADYQKEHPEAAKKQQQAQQNWGQQFESDTSRELRMIFEGQQGIMGNVQATAKAINEIVGMQDRILTTVSRITQTGQASGGQGQLAPAVDNTDLLNSVVSQQRETIRLLQDMSRTTEESLRVARAIKPGGGGGMDSQLAMHEVKDVVSGMQSNLEALLARPAPQPPLPCPTADTSCLTLPYFLALAAAQSILFIGWAIYQKRQDAAAKKFY